MRKRDGRNIVYTYDALNRMILKDIPEGAYGELDIAYSWDLLGRPLSVASAGTHVVHYVYDGFGRALSETGPMGTKTMAWDAAGRMIRLTWPDGFYVTYDYLDTGEMRHIRESGATTGAGVLATFDYDPLGRRSLLTRGNGAVTSYHYDPLGRLDQLSHDLAGSPNDVTFTFDHNPASQIRSAARDNDAYAWTGHYAVNRAYTTNGLNQYSAAGPASFAYDARGNLAYDGLRGYAYTSENRLAYIGTGPESSALFYDPLGRLHQLYHYDGTVEHLTRFDNLGDRIVSETYLNVGTLRRYVHGPDPDEVLVWYEGAGTGDRRYLHADPQGSIVAVSSATGAALAINRYDEYGIPAAANTGRFQYTGQAWLAEIGLYHYKARIYSPTLGRFLQVDPIGYDDQFNLYEYVGDDPINHLDPSGKVIILATHNVLGGVSHSKWVMIPENQTLYRNNPLFQNRTSDGRRYATIGAGPEGGRLVSRPNRERDLNLRDNNSQRAVGLPRGLTEDQTISRMFAADARYRDNLDYDLYPNGFFGTGADGFNSNGYARGLGEEVGLTGMPNFSGKVVPGWNKPVPRSAFRPPREDRHFITGSHIPR